jgi:thioredoxin reductase (NADPH)
MTKDDVVNARNLKRKNREDANEPNASTAQVIIIGAGPAGLSAAVYLTRAKRELLVIHSGKSMARWEPKVENYLGFPAGISGTKLLERARRQARRFGAEFLNDVIVTAHFQGKRFALKGQRRFYSCEKLLLATGVFHVPPDFQGFSSCIGHSIFFCKDCDGFRVQGKRVAVYGWNNETVRYAVAMLTYACDVCVLTDGRTPTWDEKHRRALATYKIPVFTSKVAGVERKGTRLRAIELRDGKERVIDALFTTRGDIIWNDLGKQLGARLDEVGQIVTDLDMRTSVEGLYAAGCVTPANCQMIIAAGQGATAAQAINRDLFDEALTSGVQPSQRVTRPRTLRSRQTTGRELTRFQGENGE